MSDRGATSLRCVARCAERCERLGSTPVAVGRTADAAADWPARRPRSVRTLDLTLVVTRLSHFFLRTLREDPADAEVTSHRLLVRAGYIRRAAPGIFTWLPLGLKVKAKIEGIIRDEMANAGAYEVHFPALLPREPYERVRPLDVLRRRHLPAAGPQRAPTTSSRRRTRRCSRSW